MPKTVDGNRARKINIDELITHKLKLDDINRGFELMRAGKSIHSAVEFWRLRGALEETPHLNK